MALPAGLAAIVLSCLALLSWPVLARLRLAWAHPGLLPALGWQGVVRGVGPLAVALAPLLGEALAEEAAGEGRLQALAACRGVPSQPRHGQVRLALERRCAQLGLDWAAAGEDAAAVRRCHGPVAPVAARPARLALAAAEACEAVLDAAWLLDGVAVVLPAAAEGLDEGGPGSGLAAGRMQGSRVQGGQDVAEPRTPGREPEDGQHAPIPDALLEGLGPRRRPWQVVLDLDRDSRAQPLLHEQIGRILDLFPGTGGLTVHAADGCLQAARDFQGSAGEGVDGILARLFQDGPAVTGVTLPATATRPAHTATPDDPHWSAQGKLGAAIMAAWKGGRITPGQAIGQLRAAGAAASGTVQGQGGRHSHYDGHPRRTPSTAGIGAP